MVTESGQTPFERYIRELSASLIDRDGVIGLVLLGSTADRQRADEWSDHDFFVVTEPGRQEPLRSNLSWLPAAEGLVLTARETEHGLKAVYDDGHVLEFAVASLDELSGFRVGTHEIAFDHGGVAGALARAVRATVTEAHDDARDIRLFLSLLLIGVGRARRGELLVAGQSVRAHALPYLLRVWRIRMPAAGTGPLDALDVFRRFEAVYPEAGPRLVAALERDVEVAARELLAIAETDLAPGWSEWPAEAVTAVRARLGW